MKIAIIGSGAIGGYFGAKMHKAGYKVSFLARGAQLKVMQEKGLKVRSILGDFSVHPLISTDKIEEIGKVDLIFMTVKSAQLKALAKQLLPLLHAESVVIPLQNGVMAYEELTEYLAPQHILGGTCRIFSKVTEPGNIQHFAVEPIIHFGEWDNRPSDRIKDIAKVLENSGIRANPSLEIQTEIWKKFIIICTSALLAVSRSSYGELMEIPETRELIREVLEEIHGLAKKMGIHIDPTYLDQSMRFMDSFAYDATTSLARDIWAGNPSELEYQNGSVLKLAEKYQVEVPLNRYLYQTLLPMERRARKKK